nr:MAG TPA: hypothetical protein [Caudoviricetes sp.]
MVFHFWSFCIKITFSIASLWGKRRKTRSKREGM